MPLNIEQTEAIAGELVGCFLAGYTSHVAHRLQQMSPADAVAVAYVMGRPLGEHNRQRLVDIIHGLGDAWLYGKGITFTINLGR